MGLIMVSCEKESLEPVQDLSDQIPAILPSTHSERRGRKALYSRTRGYLSGGIRIEVHPQKMWQVAPRTNVARV